MFQSTHPRGVRRPVLYEQAGGNRCFNPRTHEGCDNRSGGHRTSTQVSIHAPTRGATAGANWAINEFLFQSTHPRGVRLWSLWSQVSLERFNPRTHEGCDTSSSVAILLSTMFQSTHPRGVRPHSLHRQTAYRRFQSTHPRGVRLRPRCRSTATQSFNPRTHEGCDGKFDGVPATWDVSIHAPTRGATVRSTESSCKISVSIHAPTRGATRILTLFV